MTQSSSQLSVAGCQSTDNRLLTTDNRLNRTRLCLAAAHVLGLAFTSIVRRAVPIETLYELVELIGEANPYHDLPAASVPFGLWIDGCVLVQVEHVLDGQDFYNVYLCQIKPAYHISQAEVDRQELMIRHVGLSLSTKLLADLVIRTWISREVRDLLADYRTGEV